jgi:hypothetical protein
MARRKSPSLRTAQSRLIFVQETSVLLADLLVYLRNGIRGMVWLPGRKPGAGRTAMSRRRPSGWTTNDRLSFRNFRKGQRNAGLRNSLLATRTLERHRARGRTARRRRTRGRRTNPVRRIRRNRWALADHDRSGRRPHILPRVAPHRRARAAKRRGWGGRTCHRLGAAIGQGRKLTRVRRGRKSRYGRPRHPHDDN